MFNRPTHILILLVCLWVSVGFPALAKGVKIAPSPLPATESALYNLSWMGVALGQATLFWQETADSYRMGFKLSSSGMASLFGAQNLSALVVGTRTLEDGYLRLNPGGYLYRKQEPDARAETRIRFDARGNVYQLSVTPPDDPTYRPAVSRGGMNSAYDPLTALLAMIGGETQFTLFDGRRLVQVNIAPASLSREQSGPGLSGVHITRVALEGHTEKERKRMEDDRPVLAILHGGESRFPERLEAETRIGSLQAVRVHAPPQKR